MPTAEIWKAVAFEDTAIVLFDRVKGYATSGEALITIASIASISGKVYNADTLVQSGSNITFVVATTVFDTLQTSSNDARYTGTGGFNVRCTIPATCFPTGDTNYIVEIMFTDTSANVFPDVWEVTIKELISS